MASEVDIYNLALSRIGCDTQVASPGENSKAARLCRLHYAGSRDALLRSHSWNFATRRAPLAALDETPPQGWALVYAYPSDCLMLRRIEPALPGVKTPFEVAQGEGGASVIYANISEAVAVYTAKVSDPNRFDQQFIQALSWRLAVEIAYPMTANKVAVALARQGLREAMSAAEASDMNESAAVVPDEDAPWHKARG